MAEEQTGRADLPTFCASCATEQRPGLGLAVRKYVLWRGAWPPPPCGRRVRG